MQDELCELEERLSALDESDAQSGNDKAMSSLHSRRGDHKNERKALIKAIGEKVHLHRELRRPTQPPRCLLFTLPLATPPQTEQNPQSHSERLKMEKPRAICLDSVRNWLDGEKPVTKEESHFLNNTQDIPSLGRKTDDYHIVEKWVERRLHWVSASKVRSLSHTLSGISFNNVLSLTARMAK